MNQVYTQQLNRAVNSQKSYIQYSKRGRGSLIIRSDSVATFWVGGNWKCNGSLDSVNSLVSDLKKGNFPGDVEVVCAPPFLYLQQVQGMLQNTRYQVSAQNCWVEDGAYTGEISADMLTDMNVPWVILGHSERRQYYGESSDLVAEKVGVCLSKGLKVVPCVGESLEERNSGQLYHVLDSQLDPIIANVTDWSRVVIAYEPVWAIGTGVVASPEQAQEVHAFLRQKLIDQLGPQLAQTIRIVYGGSVKPDNCRELAGQPDIDGFLVGGASLSGKDFVTICNATL